MSHNKKEAGNCATCRFFSYMLINVLVLLECKDERNCEWIVKQAEIHGRDVAAYCEAYKDTAPIKQCRQTCGMCE